MARTIDTTPAWARGSQLVYGVPDVPPGIGECPPANLPAEWKVPLYSTPPIERSGKPISFAEWRKAHPL